MHIDSGVLGAVSVRYDDYVGTAAADDADAMMSSRSLYQLVGLDREQWLIVSVDLALSQHDQRVSVYAIDRYRHPVSSLTALEHGHGFDAGLPVVAFELPNTVQLQTFVAEAFQRISVRLVSRAVAGLSLAVSDRRRLEDAQ